MKYWLAVGTPRNWKTAFDLGNTWGLKRKGLQATGWKQVQIGDVLIFYAVSPVKGIIGYGVVQQKLKQDTPLWPEETAKEEVIWPLRLIFEVRSCLSPDRWLEDKVVNDRVSFRAKMGFRLVREDLATEVLAPFQATATSAEAGQSLHGQIVDSLLEIGRLQNYLCQKEYPMGKARLDAVWRRVQRSVPNFVFEVQIGGNLLSFLISIPPGVSQKDSPTPGAGCHACTASHRRTQVLSGLWTLQAVDRHRRGASQSHVERGGHIRLSPLATLFADLGSARGAGGPEAGPLHDDLMGTVSEAVQGAIGEDGIIEAGDPLLDGAVARDERRGPAMTLDEDIVEVA
jgi:hypothetical protein